MCMAATGRQIDTSVMRMIMAMGPESVLGEQADSDENLAKKNKKKKQAAAAEEDTV